MPPKNGFVTCAYALASGFVALSSLADPVAWVGDPARSGSGDWHDAAMWNPQRVPEDGDDAVFADVGVARTVTLTNATSALHSLTVGAKTTLVASNWTTKVSADNVTIGNGAVVTCAGPFTTEQMSNRVWIVCADLAVAAGGVIHTDKRGYAAFYGPGLAGKTPLTSYRGGAHGGRAPAYSGGEQTPYGSLTEPTAPGTGGTGQKSGSPGADASAGGGAIRIDATGEVRVDGRISADGAPVSAWYACAGSGGSVWITCRTISGSGAVSASAVDHPVTGTQNEQFQGGSGGRIAVHYDSTAQHACDDSGCTVRFAAAGSVGRYAGDFDVVAGEGYLAHSGTRPQGVADVGTLYFTDNRFLTNAAYCAAGWRFAGQWHSAAGAEERIAVPGSVLLDGTLALPGHALQLGIAGSLTVTGGHGRAAGLILSNATASIAGDCTLRGGTLRLQGGEFSVGGDFRMTAHGQSTPVKASQLRVWAMATNGVDQPWGARVTVGRAWTMESNTVAYAHAHASNGSVPRFTAESFVCERGATLDAYRKGYGATRGSGCPASQYAGASHGGRGGATSSSYAKYVKAPCGSAEMPLAPGSGSAANNLTNPGGGAIIVQASRAMTFNGRANAQGNADDRNWHTASAGGSVCLTAQKFKSATGEICAQGGRAETGHSFGAGGGGRVAIWAAAFDILDANGNTNIAINVSGGTQSGSQIPAGAGTVFWGLFPPVGTSIFIK